MSPGIEDFREMVELDPEDPLLRFGLGKAYLEAGRAAEAAEQFEEGLKRDPEHTASFRYLGDAYARAGRRADAAATYRRGVEVARKKGDLQTGKEMEVFLRRLEKEEG